MLLQAVCILVQLTLGSGSPQPNLTNKFALGWNIYNFTAKSKVKQKIILKLFLKPHGTG